MKDIYEPIREKIFTEVVIRRTRADIKKIPRYFEDITAQGMTFPDVIGPQKIEYKFNDFQDFTEFIKKQGFQYELEAEKYLNKIKENPGISDPKDLMADIQKLQNKITSSKSEELMKAKEQIIDEIEKEIITRYYFQNGKVQQTLDDDPEVKEAISVLKDSNRYKALLGKNK